MNEKTSILGNADVSRIGGFLLNRVSQFLKKAGFSYFSNGKNNSKIRSRNGT